MRKTASKSSLASGGQVAFDELANFAAAYACLPDWILDSSQPIPASAESAVNSSNHMLIAQVLSAIDGKRTIDQIGRMVAKQYGLGIPETIHAVRRILIDAWEDSAMARSAWS